MKLFEGEESRTITLAGTPEVLDLAEAVLEEMRRLGAIGSTRHIAFECDGDGRERLRAHRKLSRNRSGNVHILD